MPDFTLGIRKSGIYFLCESCANLFPFLCLCAIIGANVFVHSCMIGDDREASNTTLRMEIFAAYTKAMKELIKKELYVAMHGQTARFRVGKYLVFAILFGGIYMRWGTRAVFLALWIAFVVAIALHFFFRSMSNGWMDDWGLYKSVFPKNESKNESSESSLCLVLPSAKYKASYIEAIQEYQADHSFPHVERTYDKLSIQELKEDFEGYVEKKKSESRGENIPHGWVPSTTYWLIDEGEFIGRVSIRHYLNPSLEKTGGHIGYDIRPSKRGRGYGVKILALALPKAKELGIARALITCDAKNTASRKIIEKNGGVYRDSIPNPELNVDKLRFWIDIR